ncbi:unnamed protein product [Sphagnum jensenii]|uniref:Uncharacterized protein n=1 Tax=Sphagnum jensenii TaxID=128206 RepID=A0ABP0X3X7_9BRYO
MPHSSDDLGDRGVAEIQLLDEGDDAGSVLLPPGIPSECCSMAILGEDLDRRVPVKGDGDVMRAGSLDSARVRGFFEFPGVGDGAGYIGDLVDPFRRGDPVNFLFADPVPYHRFVTVGGWVPWDVGDNEEFLPRLASWCEAPDEELCEQSLRLGLRVNNPKTSLGGRKDQRLPLDLHSGIGGFSDPYKVPHHSTYLVTHPGIRVPGCRRGTYPPDPLWAEFEFCQSFEQEAPFDPVKGLFKV